MNQMMILSGSLIFVGCVALFLYLKIQKFWCSELGQIAGELLRDIRSGEGVVSEEEIARTPKSVSAMDSVYLPNIMKDFPEFNWAEWKLRVQNTVMRYMQALDEGNASILAEYPVVRKKAEAEIANRCDTSAESQPGSQRSHVLSAGEKRNAGTTRKITEAPPTEYKNRRVYRTAIRRYDKTKGLCTIHTETSASYDASGKTHQTVYDVDLIYVQDADQLDGAMLGYSCPHCGAAVTKLGDKTCAYCGSALEPINIRVWQIQDIREE